MQAVTLALLFLALLCAASMLHRSMRWLPLPILQIVIGTLAALAPIGLHAELDPHVFLLLFMFFWIMATDVMKAFVLSFFRPDRTAWAEEIVADLSVKTGGYVRGVAINMVAIAVLSGVGLFFLGVPYMLLLAIVAGITEAIPIVGPVIGGAVAALVALFTLGWVKAVQVAILYLVIQQIESNTLVPFVMNRVVALNPLAIIAALVLGTALLGIPGAILAVPAAAIVQIFVVRVIAPAARKAALRSQPPADPIA